MVLRLPIRLSKHLTALARASFPRECCGALVGRRRSADTGEAETLVERLIPLPNVAAKAECRYEIDPEEHLRLQQRSRDDGREILGYYHSHPGGGPVPSETDRAAAWPNLSYLITSIDDEGRGSVKSWRLVDDRFVEERLSVGKDGC